MNRKINIGVFGDAMVDEYYKVKANRISPEFPIPVMQIEGEHPDKSCPGGAANVAYQFSPWDVEVFLFSYLDPKSYSLFKKYKINIEFSEVGTHLIPRKKRYYNGDFPLSRLDVECYPGLSWLEKSAELLKEKIEQKYSELDVAVFSDYNKGFFDCDFHEYIKKIPISIVDPKSKNLSKWKGCTVFKPNAVEALQLSGYSDWKDQIKCFQGVIDCPGVVITQEGNGVVGAWKNDFFEIKSSKKVIPQSVIGAGDCMVAFLAMGLGQGMSLQETAERAFKAGSLYVQKKYNEPIGPLDFSKRVVDPKHFLNRNFKLVVTNGVFDIIHAGHVQMLDFAKSKGDKLVVAINSDASAAKIKAGRPINSLEQRIKMLESLESVDHVIVFDEETPLNLFQQFYPDVLVKGGDYQLKDIVGYGMVPEVVVAPFLEGMSTTTLIDKIKKTI